MVFLSYRFQLPRTPCRRSRWRFASTSRLEAAPRGPNNTDRTARKLAGHTVRRRAPHRTSGLLGIAGILEQHSQPDASMSKLRKVRCMPVSRIEVRRSIVRREQDQRIQEIKHAGLLLVRQVGKGIGRGLGLAPM